MISMQKLLKGRSIFTMVALIVSVSVVVADHGSIASAFTLTQTWPNPSQFYTTGNSSDLRTARNYLIASDRGTSLIGNFSVFLPNNTTTYQLTFDQRSCGNVKNHSSKGGGNKLIITVGSSEYAYDTENNICQGKTFNISGANGIYDSSIGRYVVSVQVKLENTQEVKGDYKVTLAYILTTNSPNVWIAPRANAGSRNNGLVFSRVSDMSAVTGNFEFGISCTAGETQTGVISVYDVDNGSGDPNFEQLGKYVYFRVTEDGRAMRQSEFGDPQNVEEVAGSTPGDYYFRPTGTQSNDRVTNLTITMRHGSKYLLKIWNVFTQASGVENPGSNYVSVSLPGDGIYGSDHYQCIDWDVDGSVNMSAGELGTGPIPRGTPIARNSSLAPGQSVVFTYRLSNPSPVQTTGIGGSVTTERSSGYPDNAGGTVTYTNRMIAANDSINPVISQEIIIPSDALAGSQVCKTLTWRPDTNLGGSGLDTACVSVAVSGTLTPLMTVEPDNGGIAELDSGQAVRADFSVNHSTNTPWTADGSYCSFVSNVPSGSPDFSPSSNSSGRNCTSVSTRGPAWTSIATAGNNNFQIRGSLGQYFCISWELSNPSPLGITVGSPVYNCRQIVKQPKVRILGNDARVGSAFVGDDNNNKASKITGQNSISSGVPYGSWSEYSLLAPSSVSGFGSGGGLNSGLTFANVDSSGSSVLGNYTTPSGMGTIPDVAGFLTRVLLPTAISGDHTFNGPADSGVFIVNGTATINSNILAGSSMPGSRQTVIIANNININEGVTRVDAWLIARGANGTINTCTGSQNLTADICSNPLRINGPIMANRLLLRRTGGNVSDSGGARAETLNLPGDAYIWMHKISEDNSPLRTTYSRELPPRY